MNRLLRGIDLLPKEGEPGGGQGKDAVMKIGRNELGGIPTQVGPRFIECSGEVQGITFRKKAYTLNFFHGGYFSEHSSVLGYYRLHYADGSEIRVPIVLGTTLSDFSRGVKFPAKTKEIWQGKNAEGRINRLCRYEWNNPFPEREIATIDIVSALKGDGAISLWAITATTFSSRN